MIDWFLTKIGWKKLGRITIDSPAVGSEVKKQTEVAGTVEPASAEVQVLVLESDSFWYQQNLPRRHGNRWYCRAYVGAVDPIGDWYVIAATTGPRILEPRIRFLPCDRPVAYVNVIRKSEEQGGLALLIIAFGNIRRKLTSANPR
jgi:hypothetical protein